MAQVQLQPQTPVSAAANGVTSHGVGVQQFVSTALYIGDLDQIVNDSQLYDFFNRVGQVMSLRVCRDMTTRRSLVYGYVNYSNPHDG